MEIVQCVIVYLPTRPAGGSSGACAWTFAPAPLHGPHLQIQTAELTSELVISKDKEEHLPLSPRSPGTSQAAVAGDWQRLFHLEP